MLESIKQFLGLGRTASAEKRSISGLENLIPAPTTSGVHVDEFTALQFAAVYAAVNVLSQGVASINQNLVKRLSTGGRAIDYDHPLQELLAVEPNPDLTSFGLRQSIMIHLLTYGNAYLEIQRDAMLRPKALWLLDPRRVRAYRSSEGRLYYEVAGTRFLPQDICHIAGPGFDGLVGFSPIMHLRETIGVGMALERFAGSFFGQGCTARGIIRVPDQLSEVAQANLRKSINDIHQGPTQAHKLMILEEGASFESTSVPNNESQFIESRKFLVIEICRAFNIPPTKLMDFERSTFSNLDEVNVDWYQSSLLPWLIRIEHELNRKLLTRAERKVWAVEHDISSTFRGRFKDQVDVWEKLNMMGCLNRNEIRAKQGLGPIEGGDVYLIPANNMQPLTSVVGTADKPKDDKPIDPDDDGLDMPLALLDQRTQPDPVQAVKAVVRDTATRMVRRECNALRKALKRPDLKSMLTALDDFYRDEDRTLIEAYAPSVTAYAVVSGKALSVEVFVDRALSESREALTAIVEGEDTGNRLVGLLDSWEESKPDRMVAIMEDSYAG